jgi:chromosomal replication initiation ATPase DnaA
VVTIGVPNIFVKNQLERKFNDLVVEVLEKNGVKPERVEYKIHTGIRPKEKRLEDKILDNPGSSALRLILLKRARAYLNPAIATAKV